MSPTVLVIGLAHGIPVILAAVIFKKRWGTIAAAIVMLIVAAKTGGNAYFGADFLGILAGGVIGWFFPEEDQFKIATPHNNDKDIQKGINEQHRLYDLNQEKKRLITEFGNKLLVKWAGDRLWKSDNSSASTERAREICQTFVRCFFFDPTEQAEIFTETFLARVVAEAADEESAKEMYQRVVPDCIAMGILPPNKVKKFMEDYESAFKAEKERIDAERMSHLLALANRYRSDNQ